MTASAVYVMCMLTSALCAGLLLAEYRRRGARLLLWSGVAFVGFTLGNALLFTDFVVLPDRDLSILRALTGSLSTSVLLYGLVWDAD